MVKIYSLSDFISNPVHSDTILSYSNPRVPTKRLDALKNGQISREATLNLQGLKTEAAREALCQFIEVQAQKHERCFLIIHGKDTRKDAPPLIKNLLNQWLPQFNEVLAFHSAQAKDGGLGQSMYYLKQFFILIYQHACPLRGGKAPFWLQKPRVWKEKGALLNSRVSAN